MPIVQRAVLGLLPHLPRGLLRRFAGRYIAGERLEDALARLEGLARRGHPGILDLLGEEVADEGAARAAQRTYAEAAAVLAQRGLDAYVSVKPTHFGLTKSEALCEELVSALAARCAELGLFVRVEMESSPTVDATLRVFERVRGRHANVGIVLQSRLFRTPQDVERLAPGPLDVRMVKGIYLEPARIAHVEPEPIREAYLRCVERLLARGAFVRLATHDEGLASRCFELLRARGVGPEGYELEVLLGVREALWERWSKEGRRVRVYVPYGPDWHAYSLRRMRENPQVLMHVVRNTFGLS